MLNNFYLKKSQQYIDRVNKGNSAFIISLSKGDLS